MTTQNRLNAVLASQKRGLVVDALAVAALVIAVGLAVIALWVRLPSFAPAYDHESPAAHSSSPTAITATMLQQSEDEVCRAVQPSC